MLIIYRHLLAIAKFLWYYQYVINLSKNVIVRRVDELGRVVIPIELRNKFGIAEKDPIEIYVDGSNIILKKYEPNCIFCGNSKKLSEYKGKLVCDKCLEKLSEIKEEE